MNDNLSIGIVIPTFQPNNLLDKNLSIIDHSKYKTLIIDSNSSNNVKKIAEEYNCIFINEDNFNHGLTRERGRKILNTDIVVFLTQDAKLFDSNSIDNLVNPIKKKLASVAYGRQIPKENANFFESFPVRFNYPKDSNIRSINDTKEMGVYTFFCSDVFSAYLNKHLDEVGGFEKILTGEDYFTCAKLLKNGKKVAYVSDAQVFHSHKFTLIENFQRSFDTGYVRGERPDIQEIVGHADKRGANFFISMIQKLLWKNFYLIPYAVLETSVKYIGFKAGFFGKKFPKIFKKFFSGQKYYWI